MHAPALVCIGVDESAVTLHQSSLLHTVLDLPHTFQDIFLHTSQLARRCNVDADGTKHMPATQLDHSSLIMRVQLGRIQHMSCADQDWQGTSEDYLTPKNINLYAAHLPYRPLCYMPFCTCLLNIATCTELPGPC